MPAEAAPEIVVAIVPREKFRYAEQTLDAVLETRLPFELLYIDGHTPASSARRIEQKLAGRPHTRFLHFDRYLGPLRSRNIAVREARAESKYLVILDNDVLVRSGWLEALVRCADEERAGAVVPCVLIGGPDTETIHHAGGDTGVRRENGQSVVFTEQFLEYGNALTELEGVGRRPTRLLEDHCILARTALWKAIAPFDDRVPLMTSVQELSLLFQRSGEPLLMEPAARVVYLWGAEAPITWSDVPLWYLSWSEKWNRHAMRSMAFRLGLSHSRDYDRHVVWWLNNHRRVPFFPLLEKSQRWFERTPAPWLGTLFTKLVERCEDKAALLIAEGVRLTAAGRGVGCPPLLSRYPRAPQ